MKIKCLENIKRDTKVKGDYAERRELMCMTEERKWEVLNETK